MDGLATGKDRWVPDQMQRRSAVPEQLATEVEALLYRHDPVGIAFGDNPDEYRPEASSIAARLHRAGSVDDVHELVRGEFARWFGEDAAGDAERFEGIARDVWALRRPRSSARP
jgi:hypothetical protein